MLLYMFVCTCVGACFCYRCICFGIQIVTDFFIVKKNNMFVVLSSMSSLYFHKLKILELIFKKINSWINVKKQNDQTLSTDTVMTQRAYLSIMYTTFLLQTRGKFYL